MLQAQTMRARNFVQKCSEAFSRGHAGVLGVDIDRRAKPARDDAGVLEDLIDKPSIATDGRDKPARPAEGAIVTASSPKLAGRKAKQSKTKQNQRPRNGIIAKPRGSPNQPNKTFALAIIIQCA